MAEAFGKTVKQLKQERTSLKVLSPNRQTTRAKRQMAWSNMNYKRSSTSSVPWQGVSAMRMMTTGLDYWQTLKQELRRAG
ncbi:hypothetical protein JOB18_023180 [Solea senegalensis]|uniref:Uncharacterized protein n=1 Tax=Solea senegalensis TaxID=28829 RepID=A0AAV6SLZ0_SOLSE|nr:hypothetical protein JOB18_023180 [Solea senegalensis]